MKKQLLQRLFIFFCLLFTVVLTGCTPTPSVQDPFEPRCSVTGRYIRGRSGDDMIWIEEGPSRLSISFMGNSTEDEDIFDDYQTGDRIRILCNNFRETSPAQTDVFECEWLEAGSLADVPQDVIEHLTRKGQMDEPITASLHRHVDGKDIYMQAVYRALWMYRPIDIIENAKIKCTGLQLYVEPDQEMMVDILYYPNQFTMEALPVISTETISLDSDLSATIYTQKDNNGKELVTVVFDSFDHKFIAQYRWDQARKQRYHEEVRQILNTITFSIQ